MNPVKFNPFVPSPDAVPRPLPFLAWRPSCPWLFTPGWLALLVGLALAAPSPLLAQHGHLNAGATGTQRLVPSINALVDLAQGQSVTIVVDTNARTSGYLLSISGPAGAGSG